MRPLKITEQITDRSSPSVMKYFLEVSQIPMLDKREEYSLAMKAFKNDDKKAKDILVKSNLRFVISVAKQYHMPNSKVPFGELLSAGNEGLIMGVERFDPTRGFKLISYAVWWIRQSIINYLNDNSRTIKTSSRVINDLRKLNKLICELEQKFERQPTVEEIYEYQDLYINDKTFNNLIDVKDIKVDSFDASLDNSGDSDFNLLDKLSSNQDLPLENLNNRETQKEMLSFLDTYLNKKEKDVIVTLFGIGTEENTVNYLAEKYNMGVSSILNIRKIALRKLKYKLNNKQLDI